MVPGRDTTLPGESAQAREVKALTGLGKRGVLGGHEVLLKVGHEHTPISFGSSLRAGMYRRRMRREAVREVVHHWFSFSCVESRTLM